MTNNTFYCSKSNPLKDIKHQIKIFHTSAVLKLPQQKYKLQEDAVSKQNKEPLFLSKTVFSFSTPLSVLQKKIHKEKAFLAHFDTLCAQCTQNY
jgi:hypothetical protein